MAMKVEKQSSKFIKPFDPTPSTLRRYRLGSIDEMAPLETVGVVLFFSLNSNHDTNFVPQLEKSLEKTLTRLYPLAGRYVDDVDQTVECNDEGAQFIYAVVNIKLCEFLGLKENYKMADEFIPLNRGTRQLSDPLLEIQVTMFECGGIAVGVRVAHKIADASTLCAFLNECISREENEIGLRPSFNSSLLFPARGLSTIPIPPMSDDMLSRCTRIKFSVSESQISKMKSNAIASGKVSAHELSKVQLVSAIIWNALRVVDQVVHNYLRDSILFQPVNLRGKMASSIPKSSCGNIFSFCATKTENVETPEELVNLLSNSVKKTINEYSKVYHDSEEEQLIVLNSYLNLTNIPESINVVTVTSWCKYPFYEVDFGLGKPIWVAPGNLLSKNLGCLIDDAQGNGVEAYVFLESKDIPCFEEALDFNIFGD